MDNALMKTLATAVAAFSCFFGCTNAFADVFGSGTNEFEIEFVTIGNPGNPPDLTGNPRPAGSAVEPVLTKWLRSPDLSSEARGRLRLLTENWKSGQAQTSDERRQVRGLEVLSRIGSHDAKQQLLLLQGEKYPSLIRKFAKEMVEGDAGYSSNPALQFQQRLWTPR